jgi:hypothetical protein
MSTETASGRIAKAVYAHESRLSQHAVQATPTNLSAQPTHS